MADPKDIYANLPGIANEQPDVFETSELPESEQAQYETDEGTSESVEILSLTADDAHKAFKGKQLNAQNIDFSDRIGKGGKTGYRVIRTEYEIVADGSSVKETPEQKYQRLQHEIRELTEEINQAKESVKNEATQESLNPVIFSKQAEHLQQQLADLHLDKVLGQQSNINLSDPLGALQKRLLTDINSFKPGSETSKGQKQGEGEMKVDGSDHLTYQLYYRPEQAKFSNTARVAELEQRLERMEALVGTSPEKLSALTAETSNKSLIGAVALLSARTKLLDPSQLEHIEGRMLALNHKLTQAADKKDTLENAEKQTKVTELYDLVKKWDGLSDSLPQVVDRLKALSQLHEQALQFSQALTHLDTAQQQIQSHLKTHGDMVKQVNSSLDENMSSIKGNFEGIEKRVKALSK